MGGCGGQWGRQGGDDDEPLPSPNNFYGSTFIKIEGSLTDYRSSLGPTWTPNLGCCVREKMHSSKSQLDDDDWKQPEQPPTHPSLPPPTPSPYSLPFPLSPLARAAKSVGCSAGQLHSCAVLCIGRSVLIYSHARKVTSCCLGQVEAWRALREEGEGSQNFARLG